MKTSLRLRLFARVAFALAAAAVFSAAPLSAVEPAVGADSGKTIAAPTAISPFVAKPAAPTASAAVSGAAKSGIPANADGTNAGPKYIYTYFFNNYLGTTLASTDAAGDIQQMEIDAFGAPLARGTMPQDVRYTGKPYDEDMGAYLSTTTVLPH